MRSSIKSTIKKLNSYEITEERKKALIPLIQFIQDKKDKKLPIRLNFICTHNSRRSILTQVWAQTLAFYFKLENFTSYSGGTEKTAVYKSIISTLADTGFQIEYLTESDNPIYSIKFSDNEHPIIGFSKHYDSPFNPASEFAAIMTCSQADGNCPFIAGAEKRIPITYEDPKQFDGLAEQDQQYMERNLQIASELFYVFNQIRPSR
ncbi:MAG: protein-tyrosine-phosphatase [Vicingaceae bacterium]